MQQELKDPTSTLSLLIEAGDVSPNGIMWLSAEGHILGFNEAYASELGYTKESFEPKTIFEVNPSTSLLSWKRLWKKLLQEKKISYETEQITADESIYPVQMKAMLLEVGGKQVCLALVENLMAANRFKDLLDITAEIAGIGSWELDLVQDNIILTEQAYRMLQIPVGTTVNRDYIKKVFDEILSESDAMALNDMMRTAVKTGKGFGQEFSVEVKGKYQIFNISASPVWLEDKTIKVYGTLQNMAKITKRTDEMYFTQYCLDHAKDMILWVNEADQKISYVNEIMCKTLGYAKSELIGQHYAIIVKNDHKTVSWDDFDKKIVEEDRVDLEMNFEAKDGTAVPVVVSTDRLTFQGKKINCSFARNVSKKKRRDMLIKMAKHSLDQSMDMIFWLNPDATFLYFNDAFVAKSGYSRKEIEKMTIVDFFPSTKMADFKKGWEKLEQGAVLKGMDRVMVLKNGEKIDTEMTVNLVRVEENAYSSTVLRDITERKQKEGEVQAYIKEIEQLKANVEEENVQLREEVNIEANFSNIISRDPNYKKVLRQVEQVADTDATVLILGETGTGKELLARAVHQLSARSDLPMVKVNCGSLPENLIESELFGHEKGSFTGAHQQKIGKFERAHKGTIFLDEIGELPLDLQTQLLRVLQEGEIERVGGTKLINIDVRIIAATNRNLERRVLEGKFRQDLYYRLNVFPIHNLPLRERREDIPVLTKHFVAKYAKKLNKQISEISQSGMNKLMGYDFLGNVRELENMIERAVILAKSSVLQLDVAMNTTKSKQLVAKFQTMEDMQKSHIIEALRRTKGKVSGADGAAALLDMNDKTLSSRMRKLAIDKRDYLKK